MSLLDKGNFVIIGVFLLIISSCEQDENIINVNVEGVTKTSYVEFNITTSEILIDSLRTDDSNFILVGDYEDPLFGALAAKAYFELQYDSGAVIADTLSLDSVVFILKIEDQLMEGASARFNMDVHAMRDSLFAQAVYLANKELPVAKNLQSVTNNVNNTDSLFVFSGADFSNYLFKQMLDLDVSEQYSYRSELAFVPAAENEALLSFDMTSEETKILIYSRDPNDSLFITKFRFNNVHFTQLDRDKSDSDLAGLSNLDSLQFSDDFSVINPMQGLFTVLDFSEVIQFLDNKDNIILNSVELDVGLTAASTDPIKSVNFYTFNEQGGINGNTFASLDLVIQGNLDYVETFNRAASDFLLSEESFISGAGVFSPVTSEVSELSYNTTITLSLEDRYLRNTFLEDSNLEKMVMIAEDRLTLNQSFVERGSVTVKIYYTEAN
ncbi:DUF4270 domain-containing protein [Cyclobacteriaceae bacterium]|nr:DUF4270 domain-containing protein [Cyclobacteriaceae bacterium]